MKQIPGPVSFRLMIFSMGALGAVFVVGPVMTSLGALTGIASFLLAIAAITCGVYELKNQLAGIHDLQHVAFEGPAHIETWARAGGHKLTRTLLFKDEAFPHQDSANSLLVSFLRNIQNCRRV